MQEPITKPDAVPNTSKDKTEIRNLDTPSTAQAISEIMKLLEEKDISEVFERLKDK